MQTCQWKVIAPAGDHHFFAEVTALSHLLAELAYRNTPEAT